MHFHRLLETKIRLETSNPINSQEDETYFFTLNFKKNSFYLKVDLFIVKENYEEPPAAPENSISEHTGTKLIKEFSKKAKKEGKLYILVIS